MTKNIGLIDRGARSAIGFALTARALLGGPVLDWIGVGPLLTAGISFCPAYALFGLRT